MVDELRKRDFGPLSAVDKTVEAKLIDGIYDPADVLRQAIEDGSASAHVVHLCLAAQYRKATSASNEDQQNRSNGIASTVMSHIWTNENIWGPIVMHAHQTQFLICYFAISEGLEKFVIDWTMVALPEDTTSNDVAGKHVWRGTLFRSFINAKLSREPGNDASSAVQCFFEVADKKKEALAAYNKGAPFDQNVKSLSLLPAYLEIQKGVSGGGFSIADRQLLHKFLGFQKSFGALSLPEKEFDAARVLLYDSETPIETRAIDILRRHARHGAVIPKRVLKSNGFAPLRRFLQRTVDVARANGNAGDAAWIIENYSRLLKPDGSCFWRDIDQQAAAGSTAFKYRHLAAGPTADVSSD